MSSKRGSFDRVRRELARREKQQHKRLRREQRRQARREVNTMILTADEKP